MTISFCVAFFASIVIVSEPTNVNFNLVGEFNSIEYLPSASVTPSVLPSLFVTATPIIGSPLSSTTLPCTVNAWASAVCDMARNARIMEAFKNLFSFIIRFFILVCLCLISFLREERLAYWLSKALIRALAHAPISPTWSPSCESTIFVSSLTRFRE